ncbi:MAG: BatD family protein [Prevotella sp.]
MAQTIQVSAPQHVNVGEQFRLRYTVQTQDIQGFRAGTIPDGLEVLMGPSTSSQSSFQMVNGHTSSSSSITYTYILSAERAGTYVIPGAHARVSGRDVTSPSIKIKVSGSAQQSGQGVNGQQHHQPGHIRQAGAPISGNDLFIRVTANKRRVHEQEPVLLTYKVYTQVELTQLEGKMPDLKGFHTQEVPQPNQKSYHLENLNGRTYRCVTWSQYVMYPQMTGLLRIPSITYKGIVVQENRNVDPFEAFFNGGSGYVEVKKNIEAPAVEIQVDPLPERPSGFSGGVGHFTISSSLTKKSVAANDPVTLRVVVSGTGNLKLIKQPEVQFPKDFDKYDPKTTDKTRLTSNGLEGNMIYDYLFVPRNQGEYTIPAIEFTYYDTSLNAYKTVRTSPLTINVTQGKPGEKGSVADFSEADQDIHNLKTDSASTAASDILFGTSAYKALISVIFLAFLMLVWIFRKRAIENADIVGMRGKRANKVASKRLKRAAKLMRQHKQDEFYDEVLRALWGYIGDKMNIPVAELSRENITACLTEHNVDEGVVRVFVDAIDECEYARYAPGEARGKMANVYDKAMKGITDIDNFLKSKRKSALHKSMPAFMLTLVVLSGVSTGVSGATMTKEYADDAFARGNYQLAIKTYTHLLTKTPSAELYYNLGNAYYRVDNIPQAILAYERASLILPADADIQHNLNVARTKTIDKMQPGKKTIIGAGWTAFCNFFNTDTWAWISILTLVSLVMLTLTYIFSTRVILRQIGFIGAVVCLVVFIVANICGYSQYDRLHHSMGAIVVKSACQVKKSPEPRSADATIIHEGTHLTITDSSIKGWYEVIVDDGTEGWILADNVEMIRKE